MRQGDTSEAPYHLVHGEDRGLTVPLYSGTDRVRCLLEAQGYASYLGKPLLEELAAERLVGGPPVVEIVHPDGA
jgi:hypothetical protein